METNSKGRQAKLGEALLIFAIVILIMLVAILVFEVDPHVPMFIGVIFASLMGLYLGFTWDELEQAMVNGISQALQSIMILIIIGILVGVWIQAGVVPSMIYYGLNILKPSIFLVATIIICAITSLATGSSWGTAGTMGIALMGIAAGMGIPAPITAGAILSGAYFGDKMSPLSDTTNLAPAMAGTDVFTHIKAMMKPTIIAVIISLVVFAIITARFDTSAADTSSVTELQDGLANVFNVSPILLLPPVIVIVAVAMKVPAIPGITIGIIIAAIMGPIFQGSSFGDILGAGMSGYVADTGVEALDDLLTTGGIENMMYSVSLTIIAMMFGGIAEKAGILEVIIRTLLRRIHSVTGLVTATLATCFISNVTMPEQYISVVIPGRMYANIYRENGLHPKLLSATLEGAGTVTSALIPWNTCGAYMSGILGVSTVEYAKYAVFNYSMPLVTILLTAIGQNTFYAKDDPDTIVGGYDPAAELDEPYIR